MEATASAATLPASVWQAYGAQRHIVWQSAGMAEAKLVLRTRNDVHGGLVEMVVWNVPEPVPPSSHHDNERGKGDHKHLQGRQAIEHQTR